MKLVKARLCNPSEGKWSSLWAGGPTALHRDPQTGSGEGGRGGSWHLHSEGDQRAELPSAGRKMAPLRHGQGAKLG